MKQGFNFDKANLIHNNKYNYSKVVYKNIDTKVIIGCPKHGVFRQTPNNHLYIANGCPSCGRNTSKSANDWLASLNIPHLQKEKHLRLGGEVFKVDGFDEKTNTVYEYLGSFWHGNPEKYNREDVNPKNGITFGELYDRTIKRIQTLQNHGYNIIYIWGD